MDCFKPAGHQDNGGTAGFDTSGLCGLSTAYAPVAVAIDDVLLEQPLCRNYRIGSQVPTCKPLSGNGTCSFAGIFQRPVSRWQEDRGTWRAAANGPPSC